MNNFTNYRNPGGSPFNGRGLSRTGPAGLFPGRGVGGGAGVGLGVGFGAGGGVGLGLGPVNVLFAII